MQKKIMKEHNTKIFEEKGDDILDAINKVLADYGVQGEALEVILSEKPKNELKAHCKCELGCWDQNGTVTCGIRCEF